MRDCLLDASSFWSQQCLKVYCGTFNRQKWLGCIAGRCSINTASFTSLIEVTDNWQSCRTIFLLRNTMAVGSVQFRRHRRPLLLTGPIETAHGVLPLAPCRNQLIQPIHLFVSQRMLTANVPLTSTVITKVVTAHQAQRHSAECEEIPSVRLLTPIWIVPSQRFVWKMKFQQPLQFIENRITLIFLLFTHGSPHFKKFSPVNCSTVIRSVRSHKQNADWHQVNNPGLMERCHAIHRLLPNAANIA